MRNDECIPCSNDLSFIIHHSSFII